METGSRELWQVLAENIWTLPQMEQSLEVCADAVRTARRVFVAGSGRSGLVGRCFCQRLRHLGIEGYVIGETVTPPAGKKDLFIAVSCSGQTGSLCALACAARKAGCRILTITGNRESRVARLSHLVIPVPSRGSAQCANSLFEQAAFFFLEAVAFFLQRRTRQSSSAMRRRHANIE